MASHVFRLGASRQALGHARAASLASSPLSLPHLRLASSWSPHPGRLSVREALKRGETEEDITVKGWVRTARQLKRWTFLEMSDGSSPASLQVVIDNKKTDTAILSALHTGASVSVAGRVSVQKKEEAEKVEIHCSSLSLIGACDAATYPLQKKFHKEEFLRTICHLRPRSRLIGCVSRVRHQAAFAVHRFFHSHDFLQIHTPILTSSDCEGAGALFQAVAPNDSVPVSGGGAVSEERKGEEGRVKSGSGSDETVLSSTSSTIVEKGSDEISASGGDCDKRTEQAKKAEGSSYFGRPVYLGVSGQLHLEAFACAMSQVFTFGPTFRAEESDTQQHLAEFWMVEAEMAFEGLERCMEVTERLLVAVAAHVQENCAEDLAFLAERGGGGGSCEALAALAEKAGQSGPLMKRMTYEEALEVLEKHADAFAVPAKWGEGLRREHELFLVAENGNQPLFVTHYPKEEKPFYMRRSSGEKETVACMDFLVPGVGELAGGSEREEREEKLMQAIAEKGADPLPLQWYGDLRKYGTVPHAGFGMGFERLLSYLTGVTNVRDLVPAPRAHGMCPL